jgi:hypothetical protein
MAQDESSLNQPDDTITPEVMLPQEGTLAGDPEGKPISFNEMVEGGADNALAHREPDDLVDVDNENTVSSQFRKWTNKPVFRQEDLTYPKLRLAQPTTPEVSQGIAKGGQWVLTGYDAQDMVTLIPVMYASAREFRPKGELKKVICQSVDAVNGVPVIPPPTPGAYGGACERCPKSQWTGSQGSRKPPECNLIYSYICWSVAHGQIIVVEFKKTSKGAGNFLNVNINNRGFANFAVNISSQKQTNSQNQTYYVPVVTFAQVDDAIYEKARAALV